MTSTLASQVEEYLHGLSEQGLPPLYRLPLAEARETCVFSDSDMARYLVPWNTRLS